MTLRPEYGEEENWELRDKRVLPHDGENEGEREIQEHAREGREVNYLDPESNEAHAPGKVCERCGAVITASQDVRLLPDGQWMHEVCPQIPSGAGEPPPGT